MQKGSRKASIFTEEEAEALLKMMSKKLKGYSKTWIDLSGEQDILKKREKELEKIEFEKVSRKIFGEEERNQVYKKSEGKCCICGRFIPFNEFTIDHIIPLAKGGTNDMDNLQAACQTCNKIKQDILPEDFYEKIIEILLYQTKIHSGKRTRRKIKKILKKQKKAYLCELRV